MSGLFFLLIEALLVIVGLVFIGLIFGIAASVRRRRAGSETLGAEGEWRLRTIELLQREFRALARRAASPEVKVVAQEAATEADAIAERAKSLLAARTQLKRGLRGSGAAATNLERLRRQLDEAQSEPERQALQAAVAARETELETYAKANQRVAEIDSRLRQAEAGLAELKARLSAGALASKGIMEDQDEFNEMVHRLKSLGASFEEASETLEAKS